MHVCMYVCMSVDMQVLFNCIQLSSYQPIPPDLTYYHVTVAIIYPGAPPEYYSDTIISVAIWEGISICCQFVSSSNSNNDSSISNPIPHLN